MVVPTNITNWSTQELRFTVFSNITEKIDDKNFSFYQTFFKNLEPDSTSRNNSPAKTFIEQGLINEVRAKFVARPDRLDIHFQPGFNQDIFLEKQSLNEIYIPIIGQENSAVNIFNELNFDAFLSQVETTRIALAVKFICAIKEQDEAYKQFSNHIGVSLTPNKVQEVIFQANFANKIYGIVTNNISKMYMQHLRIETDYVADEGNLKNYLKPLETYVLNLEMDLNTRKDFELHNIISKEEIIDIFSGFSQLCQTRSMAPFVNMSEVD